MARLVKIKEIKGANLAALEMKLKGRGSEVSPHNFSQTSFLSFA
jgi:hypothetical protein